MVLNQKVKKKKNGKCSYPNQAFLSIQKDHVNADTICDHHVCLGSPKLIYPGLPYCTHDPCFAVIISSSSTQLHTHTHTNRTQGVSMFPEPVPK